MAELIDKYFNVRIKLRNDSWTNWKKQEKTFRPYDGEIIIYDIPTAEERATYGLRPNQKFQMIKIGDGLTYLENLPFINDIASAITTGSQKGALSILGTDIFIKGLEPDQHDIIMAFQPIANYYTKNEVDEEFSKVRAEIEILKKDIEENIKTSLDAVWNKINTLFDGEFILDCIGVGEKN